MKPRKVDHIAFVSKEALFWWGTPDSSPGLKSFVNIPRGYAHGGFTVTWVTPDWACMRFKVWRRKAK